MASDTETRTHEDANAAASDRLPAPWTAYGASRREMPLSGYAALLGAWTGIFGTAIAALAARRGLPKRISIADVVLFGVATHKIGRIITRDWVTAPLRAPFTEYQQSLGGGEVQERSRGDGLQRAIGDLLTCPWCIAPWVAGTLYTTYVAAPRLARLIAAGFSSVAISDALQHGYNTLVNREPQP